MWLQDGVTTATEAGVSGNWNVSVSRVTKAIFCWPIQALKGIQLKRNNWIGYITLYLLLMSIVVFIIKEFFKEFEPLDTTQPAKNNYN
jgi:hypothetical protein